MNATTEPSTRLVHEPLAVRIARRMRHAILDGRLEPGQPIVEQALAAELGISRGPVREALQALAQQGLIDRTPYKGHLVHAPTPREVDEIYSLRTVLERFALERLPDPVEASFDAELVEACRRMEDHARHHDLAALTREDLRFHRRLIQLADHDLLLEAWEALEARIVLAMHVRNARVAPPNQVATNHRQLLTALRSGDLAAASDAITEHVRRDPQPRPDHEVGENPDGGTPQ